MLTGGLDPITLQMAEDCLIALSSISGRRWTWERTAEMVNRGDGEHRAWPLGFTDMSSDFFSNDDAILEFCHGLRGDVLQVTGGMVHKAQQRLFVAFWDLCTPVAARHERPSDLFPVK